MELEKDTKTQKEKDAEEAVAQIEEQPLEFIEQ